MIGEHEIVQIERECEGCCHKTLLEGKREEYIGPMKEGRNPEVIKEDQWAGLIRERLQGRSSVYYGELDLRYECPKCGLYNDHIWENIKRDGQTFKIRRPVGVVSLIGQKNFNTRNIKKK